MVAGHVLSTVILTFVFICVLLLLWGKKVVCICSDLYNAVL